MAINLDKWVRRMVTLPKAIGAEIDDYRFQNRFKTETDAIRSLIEKGLKAAKAEGRTEGGASAS